MTFKERCARQWYSFYVTKFDVAALIGAAIAIVLLAMKIPSGWKLPLSLAVIVVTLLMTWWVHHMPKQLPWLPQGLRRWKPRRPVIWTVGLLLFTFVLTIATMTFLNSTIDVYLGKGYVAASKAKPVQKPPREAAAKDNAASATPLKTDGSADESALGPEVLDLRLAVDNVKTKLAVKLKRIVEQTLLTIPEGNRKDVVNESELFSEDQKSKLNSTEKSKLVSAVTDAYLSIALADDGIAQSLESLIAPTFLGERNRNGFLVRGDAQDVNLVADLLIRRHLLLIFKGGDPIRETAVPRNLMNRSAWGNTLGAEAKKLWLNKSKENATGKFDELLDRQDESLAKLRESVEAVRDRLNKATIVPLLVVNFPAARVRMLFNDWIQIFTLIGFWIGVFLIFHAWRQLDRNSVSLIDEYEWAANSIDDSRTEGAIDYSAVQSLGFHTRPLFALIRGIHRAYPAATRDRTQVVVVEGQDQEYHYVDHDLITPRSVIARQRTFAASAPGRLDTSKILTDMELLRELSSYRQIVATTVAQSEGSNDHHGAHPKAVPPAAFEHIEDVLTASTSSSEYGSLRDVLNKIVARLRDRTDSALEFCRYIVWLLPSIGFVGTIVGIGLALMQSEKMVSAPPERQAAEVSVVTQYLGLAFDTTLVALVLSVVMVLLVTWIQLTSEQIIGRLDRFIDKHVIRQVRSNEDVAEATKPAFSVRTSRPASSPEGAKLGLPPQTPAGTS